MSDAALNQPLDGRVALVTGASRGVGFATALELARRGVHVIALARTQGGLEDLDDAIQAVSEHGATLIPMDMTKFQELDKLGAAIYERFGRLDMVVAAAGAMGILTPAHQFEMKDLERVMRLNFTANTRLIRTLDPLLRASDAGRAVFLSGNIAQNPQAFFGGYAASKAALETFVRAYAAENKNTNMRVNIAHLPPVQTELLKSAFPGGYQGQQWEPHDVAPLIADCVMPSCDQTGTIMPCVPAAVAA